MLPNIRSLLLLLVLLASGCLATHPQRVRVVDEVGQPVPAASVRLVKGSPLAHDLSITAVTDADGWAVFEDLPPGRYGWIEAAAPPLWHVEWFELGWSARLPGGPIEIDVQELWVGGVSAPHLRLVSSRVQTWNWYCQANDLWPYLEDLNAPTIEPWPSLFPDAAFVSGFRNPAGTSNTMEMEVEWFGFEPQRVPVTMQRLSEFDGPQIVDAEDFVPCPWVDVPIELFDPDGTPVPPVTLRALLDRSVLFRLNDVPLNRVYRLGREDEVALPCGEYEFRSDVSLGSFAKISVTPEASVLACTLPHKLRLVRLRLCGVGRGSWGIRASSATGFEGSWNGSGSGVAEAVLPVGACELSLEYWASGREWEGRETRAIEVMDVDGQDVTWTVTRE